jgi:hypothetical protein
MSRRGAVVSKETAPPSCASAQQATTNRVRRAITSEVGEELEQIRITGILFFRIGLHPSKSKYLGGRQIATGRNVLEAA